MSVSPPAAHHEASAVAVIGGGPAGLMAAEQIAACGYPVDLYDAMRSVGRKFLQAGVGGLNLTHAEAAEQFVQRYADRQIEVGRWLIHLDAAGIRRWAAELGIETFVGSSSRVFPTDFKAAPLLRAWLRRLRGSGVRIHTQHRWLGMDPAGGQRLQGPAGELSLRPSATVLALGGGSWPQLGSDAAWTAEFSRLGIPLAPLQPANCGFDVAWSGYLRDKHAGQPLKPVVMQWIGSDGQVRQQQGELMLTASGLEGGLIYAASASLREQIRAHGCARIALDLTPGRSQEQLQQALEQPRGKLSWSAYLQRRARLDSVRVALLHEAGIRPGQHDPRALAAVIKHVPLQLLATRPLCEAISSAGGVRFEALDSQQMLKACPGVFCAGEMIDWEAPTGGYLLSACLASGKAAGQGVVAWLRQHGGPVAQNCTGWSVPGNT